MCGICGVIGALGKEQAEGIVRRMLAAIHHRGPDDEDMLVAPPVALGIRRLSIIDLPGGHQPIWNETETLAIVFNGEIYNFLELRQELESLGHQFRTRSDTEVIVHAYETWGSECVEHLRGMYAFAIVEMPQGPSGTPGNVFLARDRLGIKPLYLAAAHGLLLFASEVRALLASGRIAPHLSRAALESFLQFGSVGEPMTLVEGITSLPPGHHLSIPATRVARLPEPKRYWDYSHVLKGNHQSEPAGTAAPTLLRSHLEDSVRKHLLADVPIGIFLSSGLDSSALAALASREQSGVHTFTVAFTEQEFSEAKLARRTASTLGTQHQELKLSGDEMCSRLDEAVAALDQPSMDGINTYFVSWAARQAGLKVALSGLGSDELFGGYSTFRSAPQLERLAALGPWIPPRLRKAALPALEAVVGVRAQPDAARKLGAAWLSPGALPHPYFFTRALFTPEQVRKMLLRNGSSEESRPWREWLDHATRETEGLDSFTAVSWLELRTYLASTLLRDTDAMSMSHSLEVRVPFLDHPLVEFVLGLSEAERVRGGKPKALFVEALRDLLPEETVAQAKRTFTFPWENWLRGPIRGRVETGLANLSPALHPFVDPEEVRGVWKEFLNRKTSWSRPWSLYVLNEWARKHLETVTCSHETPQTPATISAA